MNNYRRLFISFYSNQDFHILRFSELVTTTNWCTVSDTDISTIIVLRISHNAYPMYLSRGILEYELRCQITFPIILDYYSYLDLGIIAFRHVANLNNDNIAINRALYFTLLPLIARSLFYKEERTYSRKIVPRDKCPQFRVFLQWQISGRIFACRRYLRKICYEAWQSWRERDRLGDETHLQLFLLLSIRDKNKWLLCDFFLLILNKVLH